MNGRHVHKLILAMLVYGITAAVAQERQVGPMPSLAPLIERVAPAVVNISVTEVVENPQPRGPFRGQQPEDFLDDLFRGRRGAPLPEDRPPQERQGAGSGVIVDATQGYILTNHHVVEDASEIMVTLVDNRSFEATIIGTDSHSDLAVLQIDSDNLSEIPIISSNDLKVGDYVVAIGNPYGFSNTVTSGIVSGLGRQFINNNEVYEDFIQTDASINPGNSGGALVDLNGELVGINSAIISETGGNVGIGFAIPAEMVVSVMSQLLEYGEVRRGLLGINIDSVTPAFAADYGLGVESGAIVLSVGEDSAAEKAGIRINDVITSVGGKLVADSNELRNTVAMMLPGEEVDVRVMRGNRERTISAVLDLNDQIAPDPPRDREPPERIPVLTGLTLVEVPAREGGPGVRIDGISDNIVIENRRLAQILLNNTLRQGDLITAINQQTVTSIADAEALADATRTVVLEIQRNSRPRLVRLR